MKNNKTEVIAGATGFIQQLLSLKTHLNEPTEPVWELSRHRRSSVTCLFSQTYKEAVELIHVHDLKGGTDSKCALKWPN